MLSNIEPGEENRREKGDMINDQKIRGVNEIPIIIAMLIKIFVRLYIS